MQIDSNKKPKGMLSIVIIDLLDAYHYADVYDDERYAIIGKNYTNLEGTKKIANRLFVALNPGITTHEEWIEWETGHDVRIYDEKMDCLYAAQASLSD